MKMYLCFRRDNSLIGRTIQWLTCSPGVKYPSNHVWVQFIGKDINEGYEATGGRRFGRIDNCSLENRALYPLNSTSWSVEIDGDAVAARVWCMAADSYRKNHENHENHENRYGYLQIIQSMIRILTGVHIGLAESPWESSWLCSEAAMRALFVSQKDWAYYFVTLTNLGELGWNSYWPNGGRRGKSVWDIAMVLRENEEYVSQIHVYKNGTLEVKSRDLLEW